MKKLKNKAVYASVIIVLLIGAVAGSAYSIKKHINNTGQDTPAGIQLEQPAANETTPAAQEKGTQTAAGGSNVPADAASGKDNSGTTTVTSNLPNSKRGWGLNKNDNHQRPEMPSSISSVLSKYGAYWIGPNQKVVYLTFDEGYENGYTGTILDILKANNVKAVFFVTGHYIDSQPGLVKRMVDEGHIVGNHTDTHPSLPDITDDQIRKEIQTVEDKYEQVTGQKGMKYLRPPQGEYSERTLALTREMGYHNIFWSMAMVDWVPMPGGPEESYRTVTGNLHNGALILLHAVSKDNTEALDRILKEIKSQGYTFGTMDDLVS
ncbi:delta-lactam-biosynthetic de-N-acetylase [Pelotomaculum propionicicum]|uniref:Peptidoglycan-N-acetylmuramic acid deacetylase PdaA n=1 Tax=Pelotomaculum propionicicum TaxID=258475 RepID=A0A4Y7RL04_9FIRM|nr:delta-lactam-biosynthetic de-N-acetylase [Pelotomaculum propionicicum]NLI11523.1 delta-lactam-biosynthetic de-N-acetylase [Peptococcaceae bacterium]TEB09655.1 Peptidoglycan-N-acetylmuramic acid deacetylase PdaA [Pelotomaculum propionicicum]